MNRTSPVLGCFAVPIAGSLALISGDVRVGVCVRLIDFFLSFTFKMIEISSRWKASFLRNDISIQNQ